MKCSWFYYISVHKVLKGMVITKGELKQAQEFIDNNLTRIIRWTIGDIKKCCRFKKDGTCLDNGALIGAFILWCCAIDYFGGLYTGLTSQSATSARYKEFIEKYMPQYPADKVEDLRWALLHYYTVRHFVLYHHNNLELNKLIHLTESSKGIRLHLGTSIIDLEKAVNQYRKELATSPALKVKFWRYNKELSPLVPVNFDVPSKYSVLNSLASSVTLQSMPASGTADESTWFKKDK